MKCTRPLFGRIALILLALLPVAGPDVQNVLAAEKRDVVTKLDPRLPKFFALKEKRAKQLMEELHLTVAGEVWEFFTAGANEEWGLVEEVYRDLRQRSGQYNGTTMDRTVQTPVWQTVNEAYGAYLAFSQLGPKFVDAFAKDVIDSIPKGSVYFGGTDPGRWIITALTRSHPEADPFYTLTQNAFVDGNYLVYLRAMYGRKLAIPSEADARRAVEEYGRDAERRRKEGQLKAGEGVKRSGVNYEISGTSAVFALNALLVRAMFEQNPDKEFYLEESQPLPWMYPYLSPNGLIFKVNREPLKEISDAAMKKDREFWDTQTRRWLGRWLKEGTSVQEIAAFGNRIYEARNLKDFKGDVQFVGTDRKYPPQKIYGKLRAAQAAMFAWRAANASSPTEKEKMRHVADYAFRQAFALCPFSSDATLRYVMFLQEGDRLSEAKLVARTAVNLGSENTILQRLATDE